ncbi:MAG: L,D-transpeptidase family protein [Planctomycetota bacterium]|nr:L,D-transpeptidase family protein [Planctomycetota bacterium]
MALPSQGGYSSVRGGNMYRRRRKRSAYSWLLMIGAGVFVTYLVWPDGETSENETIVTNDFEEISMPVVELPTAPTKVVDMTPPKEEVIDEKPEPVTVAVVEEETAAPVEEELVIKPIPLATTVSANLEEGLNLIDQDHVVDARRALSNALQSGKLSESEISQARGVLTDLNDRMVFSPEIMAGDPYSVEYIVQGGDTLSGIVKKMGVQVDWRFIQRINNIKSASGIRPGQNLKLVTGPFHAEVDKKSYRIDLYLGEGANQVFVRSYRVGLGEYNSTPIGSFKVRRNSKLINPTWVNPRTRAFFAADDPANPIGERWIGLEGIEERTAELSGLGIHGTIEPSTIGQDASMGCVRMHSDDVAEIYEVLAEGVSTVNIY